MKYGVIVIYQSNAGPVAYGPFEHVNAALEWALPRQETKGDKVEMSIIPYHTPDYWPQPN